MRERAWEVKARRTDRRVGPAFPRKPDSVEGELLCSVWVALSETEERVYRFRRYAPDSISNFPFDEPSKASYSGRPYRRRLICTFKRAIWHVETCREILDDLTSRTRASCTL